MSAVDIDCTVPASVEIARAVQLLCLDVDGVQTDGAIYYGPDGEALKRFHTRDAAGQAILRKLGIEIAWITAEASQIVVQRARKLGINRLHAGCDDKLEVADQIRRSLRLPSTNATCDGLPLNSGSRRSECYVRVSCWVCAPTRLKLSMRLRTWQPV
ncbi:MAG: hypothetical protein IIA54_03830 [Chloroflexi bacterium]|nr:hypothetical protein [Chloroflexota bacterium]